MANCICSDVCFMINFVFTKQGSQESPGKMYLVGCLQKIDSKDALLIHRTNTRINGRAYRRLTEILGNSDCETSRQLARETLSTKGITLYQNDKSRQAPVQELIQNQK